MPIDSIGSGRRFCSDPRLLKKAGKTHQVPLQDAQRAMRLIAPAPRSGGCRAVGVVGFSAGGTFAADIAVSLIRTYAPVDAADRQSARSAFVGLIYPVATLDPAISHSGSRDNLLGVGAPRALAAERSPERHVSAATPPSFVVHAADDSTVPIDNSFAWIAACRRAKVRLRPFAGGGRTWLCCPARNIRDAWPPNLFEL